MKIIIINGPNLNLLGIREPELYGHQSFDAFFNELQQEFPGVELEYFQSNDEGALITKIQECGYDHRGIVLNAAGYSHTSIAIADAVALIRTPIVEVHITNIYGREAFRHRSYITPNCVGSIVGLGLNGYRLAIQHLMAE